MMLAICIGRTGIRNATEHEDALRLAGVDVYSALSCSTGLTWKSLAGKLARRQ
jgi:hypothetical protein